MFAFFVCRILEAKLDRFNERVPSASAYFRLPKKMNDFNFN